MTVFVYVQVLSGLDVEVSAASAVTAMQNYGIEHPEGTGSVAVLVLNQFKKVFLVTGYFLLLVWARNCAVKRHFRNDKLLLFNCLCCSILITTGGGRGGLVAYVLAGAVVYFLFDRIDKRCEVPFFPERADGGDCGFRRRLYGVLWDVVGDRTHGWGI